GLDLVVLLARADILLEQNTVAAFVGCGLAILRAILGKVRLGLTQRCVEWTRIDREQQVALLDVLALAEMHLHDLAVDLRLHVDGRESLDAADRMNRIRDSLLHDLRSQDGHRVALAESVGRTVRASCQRNDYERQEESGRAPILQRDFAFRPSIRITAWTGRSYGPAP